MRYKKNKHSSSPLKDKFDNTDFPFEASAWDEMEKLLDESPNVSKKGFKFNNRIIGLLFLAVFIFWGGFKMGAKRDAFLVNQSPFVSPKMNESDATFTQQTVVATPSVFEHKMSDLTVEIHQKNTVKTPSFGYSKHSFFASKDEYLPFENLRLYDNNEFKLLENKNIIANESIINYSKLNKIESGKNDVFSLETNEKNRIEVGLKSHETAEMKDTTLFKNVSSDTLVKVALFSDVEEIYVPIKRLEILETGLLPIIEKDEDIISEFKFDFSPYGWALESMRTIKRPLWQGKKHQLYLGYGLTNEQLGFNLKYARRLTPLMGLGLSFYSVKSRSSIGLTTNFDLDAQFYLVNRRFFELVTTIGYGYGGGNGDRFSTHEKSASGFSFNGGLEMRFCINQQWNIGFRGDIRYDLANVLLQAGFRF